MLSGHKVMKRSQLSTTLHNVPLSCSPASCTGTARSYDHSPILCSGYQTFLFINIAADHVYKSQLLNCAVIYQPVTALAVVLVVGRQIQLKIGYFIRCPPGALQTPYVLNVASWEQPPVCTAAAQATLSLQTQTTNRNGSKGNMSQASYMTNCILTPPQILFKLPLMATYGQKQREVWEALMSPLTLRRMVRWKQLLTLSEKQWLQQQPDIWQRRNTCHCGTLLIPDL